MTLSRITASVALLLGWVGVAHASSATVYGVNNSGLYSITDFTNWTAVFIGPTGGVNMTDIAIDVTGTNLYGVDSFSAAGSSRLYLINQTTGAISIVGATGVGFLDGLTMSAGGTMYAADQFNGNVYTINTSTGAATLLGANVGFSGGSLSFAGNGNLYENAVVGGRDFLYLVNTATGAATPVNAANSICTGAGGTGTCYFNVGGLALVNGILYGFTTGGTVLTLDPTSGLVTATHAYNQGFSGATAFGAGGGGIVPEPGSLTTGLFGLSICAFVLIRQRRARKV